MYRLISFCIPTYNRADVLDKSLKSYVESDGFNEEVELIVSDNASTDETYSIVKKYMNIYPNIKYSCNKENMKDNNFSIALDLASGMYVKLQNDNDLIISGGLEYIKNNIKNNILKKDPIFFTNDYIYTDRKASEIKCNSLNEFVRSISTYTTKINCFGAWKEDWKNIRDKDKYSYLKLSQEDWFFQVIKNKNKCILYDNKYADGIFFIRSKKNSYNWFQIHLDNYYRIMKPYINAGLISKDTFKSDKKNLFKHFIPELKAIYIYHAKDFPYRTDGTLGLFLKYYKSESYFWFYFVIFPFLFIFFSFKRFYKYVFKRTHV